MDVIPNTITQVNGNDVVVFNDLRIAVSITNLQIDIPVIFRNCTIYVNRDIEVSEQLMSDNSSWLPCENIWKGFLVNDTGSLIITNNSVVRGTFIAVLYKNSFKEIVIDDSEFSDNQFAFFDFIGSPDRESIISITRSEFDNSMIVMNPGYSIIEFSGNEVSNCDFGIIAVGECLTFKENIINTASTSLDLRGGITIEGNQITNLGTLSVPPLGFSVTSTVELNNCSGTINNNIIERQGLGSAIYSEAATSSLKINNNDIIGGGVLGFFQLPAVYHGGTPTNSETNLNVITSNLASGVHAINSASMNIECNDITTQGSIFSRAISIETGSDNPLITGNTLNAYRDLYTRSFISDTDNLGNCYNGEAVEAVGFSIPQILNMQFLVNPTENECFLPNEVLPIDDWFDPDFNGTAASCDGMVPGSGGSPFIEDEDKICSFLEFLDESLQDPQRRQLGIIRLTSLFKTIHGSEYYYENTIPECIQTYLDTTSLCGIKMTIDTENMVEDAILGSDTIRLQIQLQATITSLKLQQWRDYDLSLEGNTQAIKDQLWSEYITEIDILRSLIQSKQTEEEMIWTTIDSIEIEECLDSISMITMKAYKYMAHIDELSNEEKEDIVKYAKKCATQYGHGIHLIRSIASSFDNTDYREYDTVCDEQSQEGYREQEIELRKSNSGMTIIPNPNDGTFYLNHHDNTLVKRMVIRDLQGKDVYNQNGLSEENYIRLNAVKGLYILSVHYFDGNIESKKLIITE